MQLNLELGILNKFIFPVDGIIEGCWNSRDSWKLIIQDFITNWEKTTHIRPQQDTINTFYNMRNIQDRNWLNKFEVLKSLRFSDSFDNPSL